MSIFSNFNGLGIGQAIQNRTSNELANRNAALGSLTSGFQRMFDKMEEDRLRKAKIERENELHEQARAEAWEDYETQYLDNLQKEYRDKQFQKEMSDNQQNFSDSQNLRNLLFNLYGNTSGNLANIESARMQSGNLPDPAFIKTTGEYKGIMSKIAGMSPELQQLYAIGAVRDKDLGLAEEQGTPVEVGEIKIEESDPYTRLKESLSSGETPLENFVNFANVYRDLKSGGYSESALSNQFGSIISELIRKLPSNVDGVDVDKWLERHHPEFIQFKKGRMTESQGKKADEQDVYNKKIADAVSLAKRSRSLPKEAFDNEGKLNKFGLDMLKYDENLNIAYKAGNLQ